MKHSRIRIVIPVFIFAAMLLACGIGDVLSFAPSQVPSSSATTTYTVKLGDTFGKIAQDYGITVEQLSALNQDRYPNLLRDPSLMKPGMVLTVPNRAVSLATRAAQTADSAQRANILADAAKEIVAKINVARAGKNGLLLLRDDPRLTSIAARRSADMIDRDYFSHTDPKTGQEPFLRYLQADNYPYQYAGENIAEIKNDVSWVPSLLTVATRYTPSELADQFATGWLNSKDHRANIFNPRYTRTGVALSASSDGRRVVATQVFSD